MGAQIRDLKSFAISNRLGRRGGIISEIGPFPTLTVLNFVRENEAERDFFFFFFLL